AARLAASSALRRRGCGRGCGRRLGEVAPHGEAAFPSWRAQRWLGHRLLRSELDMVETALWTPTGKGRLDLRGEQAEITQGRVFQQVDGMGVHIPHQHQMA